MIGSIRGIARLLVALALVAVVSMTIAAGDALARNNDRGEMGTNQARNCTSQGGHATVYIEEQGDGTSVSYVWCEMPDGSGWSCSNTDYGTDCFTWRRTSTGLPANRVDTVTELDATDVTNVDTGSTTAVRHSTERDADIGAMSPLDDE